MPNQIGDFSRSETKPKWKKSIPHIPTDIVIARVVSIRFQNTVTGGKSWYYLNYDIIM